MASQKKPKGLKTVTRKDKDGNIKTYDYIEIKRDIGDGKERSYTGKTMKDAQRKFNTAKEKYIASRHAQVFEESNISFEDWANRWLKVYKKGSVLNITYLNSYEVPTASHLIPYFKGKKLNEIKQSDVKEFFNKMAGYSYSTQSKCMLSLRSIFKTAIGDRLIQSNPASEVRLAKDSSEISGVKESLNYDQARQVVDFAKTHPLGLDVILLLKTGMRRAELVALPLRYDSYTKGAYNKNSVLNGGVDLENKLIRLRQSISETKYGIDFGPCKNDESMRDIPFDDELHAILSAEKGIVSFKHRQKRFKREYVVSGKYGGYMRPSNWSRRYSAFCCDFNTYADENELGFHMVNPHECRFSFGSILYNRTKDIVTVSKLMGHSNIEITVRLYVDTDINVFREAIKHGV